MPLERAIHYRFSVFDDHRVDEAMERIRRKAVALDRANERVDRGQRGVNRRLRDARGRFIAAGSAAGKLGDGVDRASDASNRGRRSFLELEAAVSLLKTGWAALNKVAGAFKVPIDAAVSYERLFGQIKTLSDEVGAETEEALLGLASRVPQTVEDILTAGYQAVSGGVDVDILPAFLESASDLARTGNTDLTTTVDLMTTALNSYKARGLEAADATDILVRTVQRGKTDITQLSSSLGNAASVAASAHIPFAELNAAIAAHTKSGPGGTAEASRNIRALLDIIRNPPTRTAQAFDEIGFQYGVAALKAKGLRGVLVDLEKAVEANDVDMGALIKSTQASAALLALTGTNAEAFAEDLDAVTNSSGAAAKALGKVNGDAKGLIDSLGATVDALMVELGQEALPILKEGLTEIIGFISENKDVLIEAFRGAVEQLVAVGGWLADHGDELLIFATAFFATSRVTAFADAIGNDLMGALRRLSGAGGVGGVLRNVLRSPTAIGLAVGGAMVLGNAIGEAIGEAMASETRQHIAELEQEAKDVAARLRRALSKRGFETPEEQRKAQAQVESGEMIPLGGVTIGSSGGVNFDNELVSPGDLVSEHGDAAIKTAEDVAMGLERASAILTERAKQDRAALEAARREYETQTAEAARLKAGPLRPVEQGRYLNAIKATEELEAAIVGLELTIVGTEAKSRDLAAGAESLALNVGEALQAAHNRPLEEGEAGTKTARDVREEAKERARKAKAAKARRAAANREAEREAKRIEREARRLALLQLQFDDELADRRVALIRDAGVRQVRELELAHERQRREVERGGEQELRLIEVQAAERTRLLANIAQEEQATRRRSIDLSAEQGNIAAIDEATRLDQDDARAGALATLDDRAASGAFSRADLDRGRAMLRQAEADELAAIAANESDILSGIAGELQSRLTDIAEEGSRRRIAAQASEAAAVAGSVNSLANSAAGLLDAIGASERAIAAVKAGAMVALAAEETAKAIAAGAAGNYFGAAQHGLAAGAAIAAAIEHGKVAGGISSSRPTASGGSGGSGQGGSNVDTARVSNQERDSPVTQNINVNIGGQSLSDERSIEFAVLRAVKRGSAAPGRPKTVIRKVAY